MKTVKKIIKKIDNQKIKSICNFTKTIDGWLSLREGVFLYKLSSGLPNNSNIVEIGSFKGKSTIWLASGVSNNESRVYSIDPHLGSMEIKNEYGSINTFSEFQKNIENANLAKIITSIRKESVSAANEFDEKIDLLFIDGSHTFDAARTDFLLWSKKLKPGGWVVMHDATVLPGPWEAAKRYIYFSDKFVRTGMIGSMVFGKYLPPNSKIDKLRFIKNFSAYLFALSYVKMRKLPIPKTWRKRASNANFKHGIKIADS